uniref:Uncharacterized protein n=1 Tax=Caldicellulosiruptor owensensis TaxID=55205 RepID=A0A7C5Z7G0_9FIRM
MDSIFRKVVERYIKKGRVKIDWYGGKTVRPVSKRTGYYQKRTYIIRAGQTVEILDAEPDDSILTALSNLSSDKDIVAIIQEFTPIFLSGQKTYVITPYSELVRKKVALEKRDISSILRLL